MLKSFIITIKILGFILIFLSCLLRIDPMKVLYYKVQELPCHIWIINLNIQFCLGCFLLMLNEKLREFD
jgi:hypothetical protein